MRKTLVVNFLNIAQEPCVEDGGKGNSTFRKYKIRTWDGGRTEKIRPGNGLATGEVLKCKKSFMAPTLRKCSKKQRTYPKNAIC